MLRELVLQMVEEALDAREAERRWLDLDAAGDYLGISRRAVRRRIERGSIPYTRQGRQLLVDRRALDEQLERKRR